MKVRCQEPAYKFNVGCCGEAIGPPRRSPLSPKNASEATALQEQTMAAPKEMDVIRRAYELWQQAGQPSGKDEEFYHQAKKELQDALDNETPTGND